MVFSRYGAEYLQMVYKTRGFYPVEKWQFKIQLSLGRDEPGALV